MFRAELLSDVCGGYDLLILISWQCGQQDVNDLCMTLV